MRITRRKLAPPEEKEHSVMELVRSANARDRALMWTQLEERIKSTVSSSQLETLFHSDGLTFREVYDYVDFIVGPGFYFEGDPKLVRICDEWSDLVRLKRILEECVKDILVGGAGNAWVELGYNERGSDILALRILNPKTMDYIRDDASKNVLIDDDGEPLGYRRIKDQINEMEWRKDRITRDGGVIWRAPPGQDGRDRIAHFKLFGIGESYLGQSPLETAYKQAIIRLNLEDNVGEGGYRSGGIVAYVGNEKFPKPSPNIIDKIVEDLRNVTTQSVFGFPHFVKLDRLPSPDLSGRDELILYFASIQSIAMGIPITRHLHTTSGRLAAKVSADMNLDFEQRIASLQDRLAEQVREKLLFRMLKARRLVSKYNEVPKMIFRSKAPHLLEKLVNMLSRLGRRDLVRRDPELEKRVREELGLPTSFVDKELEDWRARGSTPRSSKGKQDIDVDEIAEAVIEHLEESE